MVLLWNTNEFCKMSNRLTEELTRERENAYAQGYQKAKEEVEQLASALMYKQLK